MSDLTDLRDHARTRLAWTPDLPKRTACRERTAFGTPKPADHANCGGGCGCECHRPTAKEIRLWTQIADEIDAYMVPEDETTEVLF